MGERKEETKKKKLFSPKQEKQKFVSDTSISLEPVKTLRG